MSFPDALRSAFARFARTAPSRLAGDTPRTEGHVGTISGLHRAPCDPSMRATRDPVSPASLRPSFPRVFRPLHRGKARADLVCREGHS